MENIEISKEKFQRKLDELSKKSWKVKNILEDTCFDDLDSRMQGMILDLLGLKQIQAKNVKNVKKKR